MTATEVELKESNSIGDPPGENVLTAQAPERDPAERETGKGKDTLKIAGKELACEWIERTQVIGAGRIVSKIWYAPGIPGGVAQHLYRVEDPEAKREFLDTVKDWETK